MSMHINRLLERIHAAEHRQQRNINLTLSEARDLHTDITRLLMRLEQLQSQVSDRSVVQDEIQIDGGGF